MWCRNVVCVLIVVVAIACCPAASSPLGPACSDRGGDAVSREDAPLPLYPDVLEKRPGFASPHVTAEGAEIVTAILKEAKYVCIPVTVENGKPLHYSARVSSVYGKDHQLHVDRHDFPTLARTGLHAEADLDGKTMITGVPVDVITYIGRPDRFSGAGFMANDEDVISVLKGDNDLVRKLGLTHAQMAGRSFTSGT